MADSSSPHPIDVIPPTSVASPGDMGHPIFDPDVPFWRPDWRDVWMHMGWHWILVAAAVLAVATLVWASVWMHMFPLVFFAGFWKLGLFAVGAGAGLATAAIRKAVGKRTNPFCIHCGYDLTGLPDGHICPECGRPFSFRIIDEYRRDPQWFIKRYRMRRSVPRADVAFDAGPIRRKKSRDGT